MWWAETAHLPRQQNTRCLNDEGLMRHDHHTLQWLIKKLTILETSLPHITRLKSIMAQIVSGNCCYTERLRAPFRNVSLLIFLLGQRWLRRPAVPSMSNQTYSRETTDGESSPTFGVNKKPSHRSLKFCEVWQSTADVWLRCRTSECVRVRVRVCVCVWGLVPGSSHQCLYPQTVRCLTQIWGLFCDVCVCWCVCFHTKNRDVAPQK